MGGFNHFSFWISQHFVRIFTISKFKNWVTNLQLNLSKSNLFKIFSFIEYKQIKTLSAICASQALFRQRQSFFLSFILFPFEYERVNMIEYWHQFRSHKATPANQIHQISEGQWEACKMLYWPSFILQYHYVRSDSRNPGKSLSKLLISSKLYKHWKWLYPLFQSFT